MNPKDFEARWTEQSRELSHQMAQWRAQHPKATLRQIEAALDERLARLRARMIEDVVSTSAVAEWDDAAEAHPPRCPQCGAPLEGHGKKTRQLQTQGGETLHLEREYGECPACGAGLFPLG